MGLRGFTGFTEFVPLSFVPYQTLLGRTHGIEELSREENLKHTAVFRLALGRSIPSLQASWVKMGLDAAYQLGVLLQVLRGAMNKSGLVAAGGPTPRRWCGAGSTTR